ncbi:MAG TPA: DUF2442 domain-containing protein [Longimicrobiaceae bacterium]|nr:DUF2442 domain-containing protein [Longimicrobiaceae bacterium]
MFLHVTTVHVLDHYRLRLEFNDGATKEVDLVGELYGEVFEPLLDPKLFEKVFVNHETGTIEWANGADFAPEFLYEAGAPAERVA